MCRIKYKFFGRGPLHLGLGDCAHIFRSFCYLSSALYNCSLTKVRTIESNLMIRNDCTYISFCTGCSLCFVALMSSNKRLSSAYCFFLLMSHTHSHTHVTTNRLQSKSRPKSLRNKKKKAKSETGLLSLSELGFNISLYHRVHTPHKHKRTHASVQ